MNAPAWENILVQERLHWGIFVLPVLAILALGLATLPVLFMVQLMENMLAQLGPQAQGSFGGMFTWLIAMPGVVIGLLLLFATWWTYLSSTITLTERRLIFRTGLLLRVTGELPLENVEAIILTEPPLGRLLGYGTVLVTSVGGLQFPLHYIACAQDFQATLQLAVAAAKPSVRRARESGLPPASDDSRYMPKG